MADIILKKGAGAFGTRLRRLSERLDRDVRELYAGLGLSFEPSWFPVVTALSDQGPLSVGALASLTGVSQPAISQIRKRLVEEGYVRSDPAADDLRRHELSLTAAGRTLVETMTPVWVAIAEASERLCRDSAPHLLAEMAAIERALDAQSMTARVTTTIKATQKRNVGKKRSAW